MEIPEEKRQAINDFIRIWCDDYFVEKEWNYEYIDAEFYGMITLTCMHDLKFEVPLCEEDNGELAIDIGDAGTLAFNGEGLFLWLWQETSNRYRELMEK